MFTGIIAAVGRISEVKPNEAGVRLTVEVGGLDMSDVALGDSIAIDGACMTVIEFDSRCFVADVSAESLRCTVGLDQPGREVNLEKALRFGDRLGGHLVSGHVDGLGVVRKFEPVGESHELVIEAPRELAAFLAAKGSAVVNGTSLTTNWVRDTANGCEFSINLIPHTIQNTALRHLKVDERVNLEIDLIARYVRRMLEVDPQLAR
ncbi:riboflavin synthase [Parachitinimonas caeni]|uniref:Riboflavin synthase n=1 Tax=Parachitinimonas caeni TaxID=3031301 RepID=A0ABT7DTM2_9NEIS|nr:riboflavin synthase [Parachitinimonas caeni]MDK2123397.1 riboflavin synthase [Parachitinimonas caeni]